MSLKSRKDVARPFVKRNDVNQNPGEPEIRVTINLQPTQAGFSQQKQIIPSPKQIVQSRQPAPPKYLGNYKTVLCKSFISGYCAQSDRCTFAHGQNDLRRKP